MCGKCVGMKEKTKYVAVFALLVQVLLAVFGGIMIAITDSTEDSKKHKVEKLIWETNVNTAAIGKRDLWDLFEEYESNHISEIFWTWFTLISIVTVLDYILLVCAAQWRSKTMCKIWFALTGMISVLNLAPLIYIFSADPIARISYFAITLTCYFFRVIIYLVVTLLLKEIISYPDGYPPPEDSSNLQPPATDTYI